jgi:Asp-tRNA(Asn)/Glu-tRNA(Gln) amidotransferase A subunit family amidase
LDHVGPLCRSVGDARILYDVLLGSPVPPAARDGRTGAIRLGVLRGYFMRLLDAEVASCFESACTRLQQAGVELCDMTIPHAQDIQAIYVHIALSEAAAYHAPTLDSRPGDYTVNVRLRLEMGRYILGEDYLRALRGREVLQAEVDRALNDCDALLLPTLPLPAPGLGVETVQIGETREPVRNVMLRLTQLFNITGHPAITVPCGHTGEGLPVGAQIVGARQSTRALLDVAETLEPYLGPGVSR